jgi:hypothetical protein
MADPFTLSNIKVRYQESREIGRHTPRQVPVGILSATATCNACHATWQTAPGRVPGQFMEVVGALVIECPKCKARAQLAYPQLQ